MGRYIKTRIVTDGLIYLNDAANSKSYSGIGTAIKNLVGYGATNTSFNQTFVSSGTTSHFISTSTSSYISNTNVSVSASTGSGFTICMMIKPQTLTNNDGWNYWFEQATSNSSIEFGVISDGINNPFYPLGGGNGNAGWQMKDNIKIEGQKVFTSVGTTTWTVPVGVTTITAVCIGGGGGAGGFGQFYPGAGGGGGGLSFGSTISVTPGEVLYIGVGTGGIGGVSYDSSNNVLNASVGTSGGPSYIKTGSHLGTALLQGGGGGGGEVGFSAIGGSEGTSTGTARTNGGTGGAGGTNGTLVSRGAGGGGAGGYTGNGGAGAPGGVAPAQNGNAGSGGGGGGGGSSSSFSSTEVINPGGGVGLFSQGSNGTGGTGDATFLFSNSGGPGSGGNYGTASTSNTRSVGGLYGGGGGSKTPTSVGSRIRSGGNGGQGAVRIVWGPTRSYPSTNTENPIPVTQYAELNGGIYNGGGSSTDWNFVVCGVTTNYYTFISTNGSTKSLGSSNDWNNSEQINLDKIFGTGTNNYSCLWNNCMIYNRELTNDEIQINFEAFRRKFNI
jgi:hypothetical protein